MKRHGLLAHIEVERNRKLGQCCEQVIGRYRATDPPKRPGLRYALYCPICGGCLVSYDGAATFVREDT